jgi:hypothetical protein
MFCSADWKNGGRPGLLPAQRLEGLMEECEQLCRILGKSVSTARANGQRNNR